MQSIAHIRLGTLVAWGLIIGGAVLVLWQIMQPASAIEETLVATPPAVIVADVAEQEPTTQRATVVYISGAVVRPGVYTVSSDARVADVVLLAGGLRPDADSVAINLAASVTDGMHVHVVNSDASASVSVQPAVASDVLAINTADAQMLADLPGIGPALAERIVAYRDAHGDFQNMEALGEVPGIGPSLQAKLAPLIVFTR